MKKLQLYIHVLIITFATLLLSACAADSSYDATEAEITRAEIKLSIPVVDVQMNERPSSKSVAYDKQNAQLDAATRVGLFILQADRYTEADNLSNPYYGYENVQMLHDATGNLSAADASMLFYPVLHRDKCAAVLYAPYDAGFTWQKLEQGYDFTVAYDQRSDENVLASDLIVGMPLENPFRKEDEVVNIVSSHKLTKVQIDVSLEVTPETICDSIAVLLTNAPVSASFSLASLKGETPVTFSGNYGTVIMAGLPDGIKSTDGTRKNFTATAILAPATDTSLMRFVTKFIGRKSGPDIMVTASQPADNTHKFASGMVAHYTMNIDASHVVTAEIIPEEGDDDWIIGGNK
jgi:hypothetical protein